MVVKNQVAVISAIALVVAILSGCGSRPQQEIIVTREGDSLPPGCSPRQVARLIMDFFDAFNNGDRDELDRFFGPDFKWYSVTEGDPSKGGRHFVTYGTAGADTAGPMGYPTSAKRDELLSHFAERHKQHERLKLIMVDVAGPSWHGGVDIAYVLTRHADDLLDSPDHLSQGKGAINCEKQQIFVWSMGSTPATGGATQLADLFEQVKLCPKPPAGASSTTVVACARG